MRLVNQNSFAKSVSPLFGDALLCNPSACKIYAQMRHKTFKEYDLNHSLSTQLFRFLDVENFAPFFLLAVTAN